MRSSGVAERETSITWERVRAIFDDPEPPRQVWERQFDYLDDELQRLARTPYENLDFSDLWYYHHDLAYVKLQPELFAYLFPACLMDWHETLLQNRSCSHGDSDFHFGVYHGRVFEKMLTPGQRDAVYEFFRDSFLERLDAERGFLQAAMRTSACGWMARFNSLGAIMPRIDLLWEAWWSLDTPGRAVAALEYCSGLMYFEGENPLFAAWTKEQGGGGPYLWENDCVVFLSDGWMDANVNFLKQTLTVEFVNAKVSQAVARLKGEPEEEQARQLERDLPDCQALLQERVRELSVLLQDPNTDGWTV